MTGMKLLLDTSVLIDVLRGRKRRRELLVELVQTGHTLSTTSLNISEVYAGMRPHEESSTESLLDALECHELTCRAGRQAGRFISQWRQKGRKLELPDTVIAAISIEKNCVLVTDNRKDFPMREVQLYPLP
jgi:predicted nucleic acid-binding protein